MPNFGEIAEPSSRTLWEDWDESTTNNSPRLQWQNEINLEDDIDILLIVEGNYVSGYFNDLQNKINIMLVNKEPQINLRLYQLRDSNQFMCYIKDYDLLQSSEIIELLMPYITKSKNVATLITKPLVEYQTSQMEQGTVIRCLSTSKPVSGILAEFKFPKLEQPNIISGISAGVVWLRENLGLSALAIIFYTYLGEEQEGQKLERILQRFKIFPHKYKPIPLLTTNLYL